MNRQNFATKLISSLWNIDPLRARTVIAAMIQKLRSERPAEDIDGYPMPKMQIIGNVAIIPIVGTMLINVPDSIKPYLGDCITDADDIVEEITQALANENVELIIFNVDSPGGVSLANSKIYDAVEAANKVKPCFAYCADGCSIASAAYGAVSPCREIRAGFYADGIGCIGSYLAYLDDTEFWAQMGITIEVFKSGEYKGIGQTELTDKQRAYLQSRVDENGAAFRANVKKYRTAIADADMQGQWFDGKAAAARGFVSGCDKTFDAAIRRFQAAI